MGFRPGWLRHWGIDPLYNALLQAPLAAGGRQWVLAFRLSPFAFRHSSCCSGTAWRATVQLIWHRLETDQQHWRCQSLTGRQPKVRGPHWHQGDDTLPMCMLPISAGGLGNHLNRLCSVWVRRSRRAPCKPCLVIACRVTTSADLLRRWTFPCSCHASGRPWTQAHPRAAEAI